MRARFVAQGLYYIATGIWPLVSLATFELVTGPKTDDWLVRTVGLLATAIGIALLVGARRPTAETAALSVARASAFTIVDVVYPLFGRISAIYLADALPQLTFIALALAGMRRGTHEPLGARRASK